MKSRLQIPAARDGIYLDTATSGPLHKRVFEALHAFYRQRYERGANLSDYKGWVNRAQETRKLVAALIGATPEEIAFVPNASTGINIGAHLIPFQKKEEVLAPDISFPSGSYAFQNLSHKGVRVRRLKTTEGALPFDEIAREIRKETRAISLSSVEFASGYRHDIKKIGELCRERGIYLLVDGTQSVGALALNVKEAQIPLLAFSPYKWLCAPMGLGIFYGEKTFLEKTSPLFAGWFGVTEPFSFHESPLIPATGRRYEVGGLNYGPIIALGEAVKIHLEIGAEVIEERIQGLMEYLIEGLEKMGIEMLGPYEPEHRSSILCISLKDKEIGKAKKIFERKGIAVNYSKNSIRVGIHYFNTRDDLCRFLASLQEALSL